MIWVRCLGSGRASLRRDQLNVHADRQATLEDLVVNRLRSTRDIASAISFLIGEDAAYISGQTLNVDGGLSMH